MNALDYLNQNYEQIKSICSGKGQLFIDEKFPPNNNSLYKFDKRLNVSWKRPSEIIAGPQFIINGIEAHDLEQGQIGNCWLISSISAVATVPEYINKIVPCDQTFEKPNYAGVFRFRFWHYGNWVDVVVDDFLPVNEKNQLIFCRNNQKKNEFFGSLLEKAYAKLNGCYEFISTEGDPVDALIDMTGGVYESYSVQGLNLAELWEMIFKALEMKSLVVSLITKLAPKMNSKLSNGLTAGHAYTVIEAIEILPNDVLRKNFKTKSHNDSIKLLKVRDPWGSENLWNGDWSNTSNKWNTLNSTFKDKIKPDENMKGIFYISFVDYCANFQRIHFIHENFNALTDGYNTDVVDDFKWSSQQFTGSWIKGVSAGGCGNKIHSDYWLNPQFTLSVPSNKGLEKIPLIIFLIQTEKVKHLIKKSNPIESIGFKVYSIINEKTQNKYTSDQLKEIGSSGNYFESRQICHKFLVEPGNYVVVPSLFRKDRESKFVLRIHMPENLPNSPAFSDIQTRSLSTINEPDMSIRSRSIYKINPTTVSKPKKNQNITNEQQDILKEIDSMMGMKIKPKVENGNLNKVFEHEDLLIEIDSMLGMGKALKKTMILNQRKKNK